MKIGTSHSLPMLGADHLVPKQRNSDAAGPSRRPQGLGSTSTHFVATGTHAQFGQLDLPPDRQSDVYGHVFGSNAQGNADARQRVGNANALLIRALGNKPDSLNARQVHEKRNEQLGEAATMGNTLHGQLESVWRRGRAVKLAANAGIQACALMGAMPEVATHLNELVRRPWESGAAEREMSRGDVATGVGNWGPPAALLGGLVVNKGLSLLHDRVQPEYFTSIGNQRKAMYALAEEFRANAKLGSELRAGSAGASIRQVFGEGGRDYLEDAMNETDRSAYDYMHAMQRKTRWAMAPEQHLSETGATSASIQATYARLAEADFFLTYSGRSKQDQPVVYFWQPKELPEAGTLSGATDPRTGVPPRNARARNDMPASERPQRWDYRPGQGASPPETSRTKSHINPELSDTPHQLGKLSNKADAPAPGNDHTGSAQADKHVAAQDGGSGRPSRAESEVGTSTQPNRVLLTGASGALGQVLREPLWQYCQQTGGQLRMSDRVALPGAPLREGEEFVACDLADRQGMHALLDGMNSVVHMGGVSVEGPFDPILDANIRGVFNLYEAARVHNVPRIVLASSNHATGCYEQGRIISTADPVRPDGYYGVSKLFAENMAQMYHDRYNIESVCLRIGSATARPPDRRGLSTWLSYPDLEHLVQRSLQASDVGCTVMYGVSANPTAWWRDIGQSALLGYEPKDNAEDYRADVEKQPAPDPASALARFQGGVFLDVGPFDTFGKGADRS